MARGWESKEIESQMEAAEERAHAAKRPQLGLKEINRQREIESLELSRTRVLQDFEAAKNPKYRTMLQQSLAFLDEKLALLKTATPT